MNRPGHVRKTQMWQSWIGSGKYGESVNIEIDSGAEVSCLTVNIGADTYPLHGTLCGGHHVAAGSGKLHELGTRILGLEAANVRTDAVVLLVRFRAMNIGKALLSTQDMSRCGWGRSSLQAVEMRTSSGKPRTLASRS